MKTMLVCGGRYYGRVPFGAPRDQSRIYEERARKEAFVLYEALDHLKRDRDVRKVISGGAPGADDLANRWAVSRCIQSVVVKAEWKRFGKGAGPIRNRAMIELKPDFVVAFDGGDGTLNMIDIAREAGVEVIDYRQGVQ